jgi:hypothetical protein
VSYLRCLRRRFALAASSIETVCVVVRLCVVYCTASSIVLRRLGLSASPRNSTSFVMFVVLRDKVRHLCRDGDKVA